jgi:hypothetical protein
LELMGRSQHLGAGLDICHPFPLHLGLGPEAILVLHGDPQYMWCCLGSLAPLHCAFEQPHSRGRPSFPCQCEVFPFSFSSPNPHAQGSCILSWHLGLGRPAPPEHSRDRGCP